MSKASKRGRRYDDEFKQQAVLLVIKDDMSVRRAAADLGVSEPALARWVEDYRESTSPSGALAKDDEHKRLKKELELVKTERDILRKAVGIFSQLQK